MPGSSTEDGGGRRGRFTLRFAGAAVAVGGLWWLASRWAAPALITEIYHEGAPELLNRILAGRASHPLSEYLADWRRIASAVDRVLLVVGGLVYAAGAVGLPRRLARLERALEARERRVGPRDFRPAETLWLAACTGVVTGFAVAGYLLTKTFVLGEAAPGFRLVSRDIVWMSPTADAVTFLAVAALLLVAGHAVRRLARRRVVASLLLFMAALSLLMMSGRLHIYAGLLLAAGLGYQGGRAVAAYWDDLARRVRPIAIVGLLLIPILAVGNRLAEHASIRRTIESLPPAAPAAANVLLLVLDTVRARSTSLHGYPRPTTPNLERLAASGTTFERAIATASWSLPSHASMLTGRYGHELGGDFVTPLEEGHPTLAELLSEHGYVTMASVANLVFGTPAFGLDRGFALYRAEVTTPAMVMSGSWLGERLLERIRAWLGNHQWLVRRRATDVNEEVLGWIDEHAERPFFAMVNYFDAHEPYRPPAPFDDTFREGLSRYWVDGAGPDDLTERELEDLIAAYDGSIAYVDHVAGRLFEALEERGLLQRTLVLVTSDHGEAFGEHGRLGHASSVYMTQVHVPLVVHFSGAVPGGVRVGAAVSLVDIPATVTGLLSLGGGHFPGASLARHWGEGRGGARAIPVFSESIRFQRSVVLGDLHYLRSRQGREEVYDLASDPEERDDLAPSLDDATLERLRAALDAEAERPLR